MTITLQLSADQESRLEEGAARHDTAVVREILLQAVDSVMESILRPLRQPRPQTRRTLLAELAREFADAPALSEAAVSRESIYHDHL